MNAGPYSNLRVIECGNGTACAFAGQILADKGAEVIKVEPRQGDDLRWRDPHRHGESKAFQWLCRGKRSIVVVDDTDAGRAVLARLAKAVDVVLTNWPPGASNSSIRWSGTWVRARRPSGSKHWNDAACRRARWRSRKMSARASR